MAKGDSEKRMQQRREAQNRLYYRKHPRKTEEQLKAIEEEYQKRREIRKERKRQMRNYTRQNELRKARLSIPENRERANKLANDRATNIRRWIDSYKIEHGCVDCGFNKHPAALHFDHIDESTKSRNVCNSKSIKQAQAEISKCVVRCANCHAIKTWPHLLIPQSTNPQKDHN